MLDAVADGGKYLDQHIGQHALGVPASNSCDASSQRADTLPLEFVNQRVGSCYCSCVVQYASSIFTMRLRSGKVNAMKYCLDRERLW